jgi:hypothetical protein
MSQIEGSDVVSHIYGVVDRRVIEDYMATIGDIFKPGDDVPHSGIYRVVHDPEHASPHDVTCIYGKTFPPCRGCRHPRFELRVAAIHIGSHEHFK